MADKSTVVSTSTRNFPNRLGKGANVFLASAELASIAAIEGKLPSVEEYQKYASKINETAVDTFRYLNFDQLGEYVAKGKTAEMGEEVTTTLLYTFTCDKGIIVFICLTWCNNDVKPDNNISSLYFPSLPMYIAIIHDLHYSTKERLPRK